MVGIIWALVIGFAAIRIAGMVCITILIEDNLATVEQAKELYKDFVKLKFLRREDEDKWGRKR